jgi:cytochrome c2
MNPQILSRIISAIQMSMLLLVICMITVIFIYANQDFNTATSSTQNTAVATVTKTVELNDEQKHGQELFTNNCTSCHAASDEVVIGPGLKGISQRRPIDWIVKWVHNPQAVIASGDKYAVDLYNKFNKTQMTAFPNLKDEDIKAILAYIDAN